MLKKIPDGIDQLVFDCPYKLFRTNVEKNCYLWCKCILSHKILHFFLTWGVLAVWIILLHFQCAQFIVTSLYLISGFLCLCVWLLLITFFKYDILSHCCSVFPSLFFFEWVHKGIFILVIMSKDIAWTVKEGAQS